MWVLLKLDFKFYYILIGTRPHLERLIGSTVLRIQNNGILAEINNKIDIDNQWASNEACHGDNQHNFVRVFSQNCEYGECMTLEDNKRLNVSSIWT